MNRDQKAAVVERVTRELNESEAVFAIDYRGISVSQVAELRAKLKESEATFRVVKNTLTLRAAEQAGVEPLKDWLDGPTALTLIKGDAAAAAKTIANFASEHDLLEFKGGLMGEDLLDADRFKAIARLPALGVMHGQLVGVLASPITGLARGLGSLISGLAVQLQQIQEQGLIGGGEAPLPPEEPAKAEAAVEEASEVEEAVSEETEKQDEEE